MQLVKGTGSGNVSALSGKSTSVCLGKQGKYLIKFQSLRKIKCSDRKSLAKACAVSVQIRKTILCVKACCLQLFFQNMSCLFCLISLYARTTAAVSNCSSPSSSFFTISSSACSIEHASSPEKYFSSTGAP